MEYPFLAIVPGSGVVASDHVLFMGQTELFDNQIMDKNESH